MRHTISIKGQGGAACVAEAVAEGLLRQIAPCLSWRRLWALWRQFVRKTKSHHPLVNTVSNSRHWRACQALACKPSGLNAGDHPPWSAPILHPGHSTRVVRSGHPRDREYPHEQQMMHFRSTMPLVGGYFIAMTFCNIIQNIRRSSTISVVSRLKPRVEAASAFCTQSLPKPRLAIPPLLTRAKNC